MKNDKKHVLGFETFLDGCPTFDQNPHANRMPSQTPLRCLPVPRVQVADRPQPLDQQHLLSPAESEICLLNAKQRRKGKKLFEKGKRKKQRREENGRKGKKIVEGPSLRVQGGSEGKETEAEVSSVTVLKRRHTAHSFATLLWDTVVPHCHLSRFGATHLSHSCGTLSRDARHAETWGTQLTEAACSHRYEHCNMLKQAVLPSITYLFIYV